MKFKLGDNVFWIYSSTNYNKTIPCPMCFGKRFVTVILGDESQVKSACGFCERGMEGSTGYATTWEPIALVKSGEVSGISNRDGVRYEVGRETLYEHELYDNEKDAELIRQVEYEKVKQQSEQWLKDKFVTCTKKQSWSVGYHKSCIEREERTIEWHKNKLNMIKEKQNPQKGNAK